MEPSSSKDSVVSRLFGFGRKRPVSDPAEVPTEGQAEPTPEAEQSSLGGDGQPLHDETGFARTSDPKSSESLESGPLESGSVQSGTGDADIDAPHVTIPEQVIRIRTTPMRKKEDIVDVIGDSFKELTSMLGSVSDRLDRQDGRSADLSEQLTELPEYLRTLPRLHQEQNEALRDQGVAMRDLGVRVAEGAEKISGALQRVPEAQEQQARAISSLGDRVAEGTEAVHGVVDAVAKIPDEIRERAHAHEAAIRDASTAQTDAMRQVAAAHQNMAKAVHQGQQRSLQVLQSATKQTVAHIQKQGNAQQDRMETVLDASVQNMRRMFVFAAVFMGVTVATVVALMLFR